MTTPILTADAIEYYWDRCYEFVMENIIAPAQASIWPGLKPTPDQKALMDEISIEPRVAVESGHGTGKSSSMSWIGIWFLSTRQNNLGRDVKVPVVAPTFHQLYDVIWPEFKRWLPVSRVAPLFQYNNVEVFRVKLKDLCWARARSPKIPQNLQGMHAAHLLWLIDEAFNILDELVWENVEGSMTTVQEFGENKIIIAGQHTTIVGYTHDAFNRDREFWKQLRFNSEVSPIADKSFNDRIAKKYGKNSDVYRVRVLGQAPKGNPEAFITLEEAELARHREVLPDGSLEAGVDCARFGDDLTVSTIRKGNHVFPQKTLATSDSFQIADLFLQQLRAYRHNSGDQSLCRVKVDASGGYGAGAIDILNRNTEDNIEVIPVYTEGIINDTEYYDGSSKMWGELKDVIEYISLPDDDFLIEELSTRRKRFHKGKIRIEPKSDYKSEYQSSPDRADSLVLAFTKKAGIQRVFAYYRATDPEHHRYFEIPFKELIPGEFQIYSTLYLDTEGAVFGSAYFWGRNSQQLYVYGEMVEPNPVANLVAIGLRRICGVSLDRKQPRHVERVFANDLMFKGGSDMQYLLRKSNPQVRVYEPVRYEEAGATMLANKMFMQNQIVVSTMCKDTDYQYRYWRNENQKPIKGFPFCRGLLLVVAELRSRGEIGVAIEKVEKPYSKKKRDKQVAVQNQEFPRPGSKRLPGYDKKQRNEFDYLTA